MALVVVVVVFVGDVGDGSGGGGGNCVGAGYDRGVVVVAVVVAAVL